MKRYVILPLVLMSFIMNAQRGEEKQQTLSLDRNHYAFNGEKTGFNFTGMGFGYQFVNCGGDVQLGINYSKNVNFTTFSYNEKNVGASEVGSALWPKPNEIELQEVKGNLYFGNQNLGKIHLNYIVGNFSGCFGETFDVLAQVGQDPKAKQYKDQINELTLRNITIIRADAIGDNRKYKIIETLKTKDTDAEVLRLFKAADVESSLGNYERARGYYQDANRLIYNPETQNRINEMNRLIGEKNAKEKAAANSAPSTPGASSSAKHTTSKPTSTVAKETGNKEEKEEEQTTGSKENDDTYIDRSARNEVRQNSGANHSYHHTNQNNNALVAQGYAINQQSKRTEQVIDNAVNEVNSIFQGNINRINHEQEIKNRQDEEEWADHQRRQREKQLREQREAEEWRKQRLASKAQSRQERLDAYNAKGGTANYNRELLSWRKYALLGMEQINQYLSAYKASPISFGENMGLKVLVPQKNCDYVQAIESIQHSVMPVSYKYILIHNLLNIRFEYYKFYVENAYIDLDWKLQWDDLYWDVNDMPCGNYLDDIAFSLRTDIHNPDNGTNGDVFGSNEEKVINNTYSDNILSKGNYTIPVGSRNSIDIFKNDIRKIGLTMPTHIINNFVYENESLWKEFHNKPYDWSRGNFREANLKYADGIRYTSKILTYDAISRKAEIEKYMSLYNIKRAYALNNQEEEAKQMYFNYHMGNLQEAYNHLQRFLFLEYDGFQELLEDLKTNDGTIIKDVDQSHNIAIATAFLLMENKEFENALELTDMIKETNRTRYQNSSRRADKEYNYSPLISAAYKISNRIHYQMGNYDKMLLQKDEAELKNLKTRAESIFKFTPRRTSGLGDRAKAGNQNYNARMPIILNDSERQYLEYLDPHLQASALLKLGHSTLAKAVLEDMVKYYTKNDKNYPHIFYGSQLDIDVFKETVSVLFPGKENKMQFRLGNTNLFKINLESQNESPRRYLTKLTMDIPKYLNTNSVDVSAMVQWESIKKSIYAHNGSKEKMTAILNNLREIQMTGKLVHHEESKFFLEVYMHFALALGEFHEAVLVISQLDQDYPNHGLILERNLLKLMWPQKQNELNKKLVDKQTNLYTKPSPLKTYFETEVKNSEHLKNELNEFLSLWSNLKVTSPMIPYLYSLY
ncbi:hypothetical protein VP395_03040 [Mariniflexile soesokkakense]|uniref:Tetratricopeptide repeat protein n=1 Tax=Mariniflexile soesokkakense TaxID=1343160 RepID=A0ABV0A6U1_9FLAO